MKTAGFAGSLPLRKAWLQSAGRRSQCWHGAPANKPTALGQCWETLCSNGAFLAVRLVQFYSIALLRLTAKRQLVCETDRKRVTLFCHISQNTAELSRNLYNRFLTPRFGWVLSTGKSKRWALSNVWMFDLKKSTDEQIHRQLKVKVNGMHRVWGGWGRRRWRPLGWWSLVVCGGLFSVQDCWSQEIDLFRR